MHVARDLLPQDDAQRHGFLRTYFCDKDAQALASDQGWQLHLGWSGDQARHVDPRLDEGLAWWGDGLPRQQMWQARRRSGKVMTALYDTWTLHSWSQWLQQRGQLPQRLVILHVDDHRDLGSPRLLSGQDGLRDPISGQLFDLHSPPSVLQAIASGAVGMGSFMTPFVHAYSHVEVRHLCQPPKVRDTRVYTIELTSEVDQLLAPGCDRPAVRLAPVMQQGVGSYLITHDIARWAQDLHRATALLHVDMDYFNNRYDGDSDWSDRQDRLDPSPAEVALRIEELVQALGDSGVVIEDVVLAMSPGFFPAELWAQAHERLTRGLRQLL